MGRRRRGGLADSLHGRSVRGCRRCARRAQQRHRRHFLGGRHELLKILDESLGESFNSDRLLDKLFPPPPPETPTPESVTSMNSDAAARALNELYKLQT